MLASGRRYIAVQQVVGWQMAAAALEGQGHVQDMEALWSQAHQEQHTMRMPHAFTKLIR